MYAANAMGRSIPKTKSAGIADIPSSGLLFHRRTELNDAINHIANVGRMVTDALNQLEGNMTRQEYEERIVNISKQACIELEPSEYRKLMIDMSLIFKDPEEEEVEEIIQ